jgi:hypothetical protein
LRLTGKKWSPSLLEELPLFLARKKLIIEGGRPSLRNLAVEFSVRKKGGC